MKSPNFVSFNDALDDPLSALICEDINKNEGSISFARFMELALYNEKLGYYSGSKNKFGKKGDFVTAPLLSHLFARCLSIQCQQILDSLQGGDILEFGAGTGVLAKDLLLELEKKNSLPNHYYIFEVSADLKVRQKELLNLYCPHLNDRVRWIDQMIEIDGIMFANEVMDAFPFHCFRIENNKIKERKVTYDNGFKWHLAEATDEIKDFLKDIDLPNGYESEINFNIKPWITSAVNHLKRGIFLLCDYGYGRYEYYHRDRMMGTLLCYTEHQRHDNPFILVGKQDITAHVDFTSVIESAFDSGAKLAGYTTQSGFLFSLGLLDHLNKNKNVLDNIKENQLVKMLTLPTQMGESIKMMALSKYLNIELNGFQFQDRQKDL